jgi:hypothetical protein
MVLQHRQEVGTMSRMESGPQKALDRQLAGREADFLVVQSASTVVAEEPAAALAESRRCAVARHTAPAAVMLRR